MQQAMLFSEAPAGFSPNRRIAALKAPAAIDPKGQYQDFVSDLNRLSHEWAELHVWVLIRHLHLLASVHTERAEREDILAWLEAPVTTGPPAVLSAQACLAVYDVRIDLLEFQRAVRLLSQRVAVQQRRAVA